MSSWTQRQLRKLVITGAWLLVSALPSLVLYAIGWKLGGTRGDQTPAVLLWLTLLGGLATSGVYRRALAATPDVKALPPDERRLEHLPASCARLVREAETIRVHVDALGLEAALQRAWELAGEVERADPVARAELERAGASLQAIRELVSTRSGHASADAAQERRRLVAALEAFERALASPGTRVFR